ncbi:MAG: hypothetical protein DWI24_08815 [Planctomycetota bacterium]|nr:MAG: hypothetical protein DWI24_08815 [Planctomycetota bacterium]
MDERTGFFEVAQNTMTKDPKSVAPLARHPARKMKSKTQPKNEQLFPRPKNYKPNNHSPILHFKVSQFSNSHGRIDSFNCFMSLIFSHGPFGELCLLSWTGVRNVLSGWLISICQSGSDGLG